MSFDDLVKSDVRRKEEVVKITVGDKELKFTAHELSYPQRLQLAVTQKQGGDSFSQLLVFAVKDQDGMAMTLDQAQSLPEEYFTVLFKAASAVNSAPEKN